MPLPNSMRYIAMREPGPPDVLYEADGPMPKVQSGEVLIEVAYAGVNRPDCLQRAGAYPPPADASPIIGLEVAGRIAALGEGVTTWQIGDEVCALTPGGGYAQYCATPAGFCLPIPAGTTLREAAGIPENYFTVWYNVFDRVHLAAGESILIHGGSSGIGLTAIQLAKAFGATVFTTAGSTEKVAFCSTMGADHAFDYKTQDFVAEVFRITNKRGVNVVLDMVGGDYVEKNLKCLALEGRLTQIGFLDGSRVNVDAAGQPGGAQGGAGRLVARTSLAAVRAKAVADRDPGNTAHRAGVRCTRADGVGPAYRQGDSEGRPLIRANAPGQ
jgi:NADPH:quinone reductase